MSASLPFSEGAILMNVIRNRAKSLYKYLAFADTVAYIHEHCSEEATEIIRQADMLLKHTFIFTDRWEMEPCDTPYTVSLRDWITSPNGDPEWVFMLNRHDFLHKLWQAYLLTGNAAYTGKLKHYLLDWIEKNPITEQGTDATRTIDTGIRCMNWTVLLMHLLGADLISDTEAKTVLDSLAEQCRNMRSRYIGKYALSNWGVLQTTAICTAHIWFPEYIPIEIANWAWRELRLQLSLQILSDGSHWEQSPMYHVEVLNTCTKLLAQVNFAESIGIGIRPIASIAANSDQDWSDAIEASALPGQGYDGEESGWLTDAVRVLSRHVLNTCDPAFYQLPLGDSDVTDVRDVLSRATVLLPGGGIYRYGAGERMDIDSVFLLGKPGLQRFYSVSPVKPVHKSWNCVDSGNLCFRSDWSEDASFTALKCGTLGSSHGHADQSHLTLYHKGQPFLIDSGRYTYLEEDPLRPLLKKPCAHNVCVIDGQSGGAPNGSWSYHSFDETLKNYYSNHENAHYAEMGFHGVLSDGTPYLVKRKIMALDDGIWLSAQDIVCQGNHVVKEYFHLHEKTVVGPAGEFILLQNEDAQLKIFLAQDLMLRFGVASDKYNEKHSIPILIQEHQMQDRFTSFTLFVDGRCEVNPVQVFQMRRAEPVPPEIAAAWDVVKPDGKKYTLILWNRETCKGDKLYTCHGVSVYGKAAVLDWDGDECGTIRLKV